MSFQAVTGVSTNTPSVGGEARRGLVQGAGTQRPQGPRSEGLAAHGVPRTWPPALDGCQEFWGPDEVRLLPQTTMETLLSHMAAWEPRAGFISLIYNSLRNE